MIYLFTLTSRKRKNSHWKAHNSYESVSVLPVGAIECMVHTNVVLSGDFSVYVSLTEMEKLSLEGTFNSC